MPPFGPLPRHWYVIGGLAACLLVSNGLLAWRQHDASERVTILRDTIRVVDARYTRDTIRLTQRKTQYRTTRDTLVQHTTDTVLVTRFIAAADSALAACDSALATANKRVALRDTLVREVVKAVTPKPLQLYGEALAGTQWRDPELRAGATMRITSRVHVVGEVAHRLDDGTTMARAGLRVVF